MPGEENAASIVKIDTRLQIAEKEIDGLRADRHKHGAAIQVHELEIELLKQAVTGGHGIRLDKLETASNEHTSAISDIRSDIRLLVWRVGAITGGISGAVVFLLNYVSHLMK